MHGQQAVTASWDCSQQGHLEEFGSYRCRVCGENLQMSFEDVVELEHHKGDADYTRWLADGRPQIDTAVAIVKWKDPGVEIETLPGL